MAMHLNLEFNFSEQIKIRIKIGSKKNRLHKRWDFEKSSKRTNPFLLRKVRH